MANGIEIKCAHIEDTVFIEIHIDGVLAKVQEDHDAIDIDHIDARTEFLQSLFDTLTQEQALEVLWPSPKVV